MALPCPYCQPKSTLKNFLLVNETTLPTLLKKGVAKEKAKRNEENSFAFFPTS
ncbi:hypothetical protein [Trichocoleus sp. FACHB-832]|uniref:hypothetical protein n=1 Tax=Trichocoleus sp. FACHB-832 TaxID=2692875 RepID=UPI001689AF44|nr:hypothetical protein [Trichocoleus sp. FACHB-832]